SPAKNTPAQKNIGSRQLRSVGVAAGGLPAGGGAAAGARAASAAHTASSGSAKAPRQNAVAVGPVSDSRTNMPELPIASAPANSAMSAGTSDASWRAGMGCLRTAHHSRWRPDPSGIIAPRDLDAGAHRIAAAAFA